MPRIGQTVAHYKILKKIGRGGMGIVYKAEDTKLGRPVALKFLPEELSNNHQAVSRFKNEARSASAINHPHICTIHSIDEYKDQTFIIMELLEGPTLKQRISNGPLKTKEMVDLAIQIADALDAAHAKGIIHRDIKPTNIIVNAKGQAKILDFGLAKLASIKMGSAGTTPSAEQILTRPGGVVGTIAYMSPEQARGEEIDFRSDLFSFGCLLYEMATGQQAFKGNTSAVIFDFILNKSPISPARLNPDLPDAMVQIINKALHKDRALRYQSASSLQKELRRLKRTRGSRRGTPKAAPEPAPFSSLAVLPFANLSKKKGEEYFADGITTEIIMKLAKIRGLLVISRTSTMRYKDSTKDIREIGKELGVTAIMEGGVRKSGQQCKITAQLIDVKNGFHIWAEGYDFALKDVFAVQDRVSTQIAKALSIRLAEESSDSQQKIPTTILEAYKYYLQGRQRYYKFEQGENRAAIRDYKKALQLDPNFAKVYSGLASAYIARVERQWESEPSRWMKLSLKACEKAIALNPSLAEAHSARGLVHFWQKSLQRAGADTQTAIQLDANDEIAQNLLGRVYFQQGEFLKAKKQFQLALKINPHYVWCLLDLVWVKWLLGEETEKIVERVLAINPLDEGGQIGLASQFYFKGQFNAALPIVKKCLELSPNYLFSRHLAALVWAAKGSYKRAIEICMQALAQNRMDFLAHSTLGIIYAKQGDVVSARQANKIALGIEPFYIPLSLNIAIIHCHLKQYYWARRWLEKAFAEGAQSRIVLQRNPLLRRFRKQFPRKNKGESDHAKTKKE